ncbi:MAG: ATP-binding protein [Melioribacteraceae bacterium]|nr:ATP-binding protein [Melioribacteraceae bacterium]
MDEINFSLTDILVKEQVFNWVKEQATVGLLITDDSLIVTFVNNWLFKNCPNKKECIGQHLFEIFPEIKEKNIDNNYRLALTGVPSILSNKLHKYLIKIPYQDYENRVQFMQQSVKISPLIQENKIVGTVTLIEDVTDRVLRESELNKLITQLYQTKNLIEESEEKFRTLAENIPDTIVRIAKNFKYTYVNKESLAYGKLKRENFIGKTIEELNFLPQDVIDKCNKSINEAFEFSKSSTFQYSLFLEGKKRYYEIRYIPEKSSRNNEVISVLAINREITEFVEINNKLKNYAAELEKLNNTKNKFFSILAHDLRSPFFPLLNISDFLVEDFDSLSNDEIKKEVKDLNILIHNLYTLVENLLSWAQFEKGAISFFPSSINLTNEIESIINLYYKTAEAKNVKIINKISEDITFEADLNLFKTLLRNLISNAIKFTPGKKSIYINALKFENYFELIVKDEGIGMDDKVKNSLFNLSEVQSTRGTEGEKGTGLGLILCKEIVEKHKGELKVESEIGNGTTIICKFPYNQ